MNMADRIKQAYGSDHDKHSDEEIQDLAVWFQSLTLQEVFFLKGLYENILETESRDQFGYQVH